MGRNSLSCAILFCDAGASRGGTLIGEANRGFCEFLVDNRCKAR